MVPLRPTEPRARRQMRLGGRDHQLAHGSVLERGDCIRDGDFGFGTTSSRHTPDRSDTPIVVT